MELSLCLLFWLGPTIPVRMLLCLRLTSANSACDIITLAVLSHLLSYPQLCGKSFKKSAHMCHKRHAIYHTSMGSLPLVTYMHFHSFSFNIIRTGVFCHHCLSATVMWRVCCDYGNVARHSQLPEWEINKNTSGKWTLGVKAYSCRKSPHSWVVWECLFLSESYRNLLIVLSFFQDLSCPGNSQDKKEDEEKRKEKWNYLSIFLPACSIHSYGLSCSHKLWILTEQ